MKLEGESVSKIKRATFWRRAERKCEGELLSKEIIANNLASEFLEFKRFDLIYKFADSVHPS